MEEMVEITKKEYASLLNDRKWLYALEAAGLDNWEGCNIAKDYYDDRHSNE